MRPSSGNGWLAGSDRVRDLRALHIREVDHLPRLHVAIDGVLDASTLDQELGAAADVEVLPLLARRLDHDRDVGAGARGCQLLELRGVLALLRGDVDGVERVLPGPLLEVAALDLDLAHAADLDGGLRRGRAGDQLSDRAVAGRALQREDRVVVAQRLGGGGGGAGLAAGDSARRHLKPTVPQAARSEPPLLRRPIRQSTIASSATRLSTPPVITLVGRCLRTLIHARDQSYGSTTPIHVSGN